MSQIEIEILKQGTDYKNVISVSFFTMPGAYRKVEVYQRNLKTFLQKTKNLKEFQVRIYTDNSGKDFVLDVTKDMSEVTVLKYDCPFFHEENGHTGTFGTIVRFLPLFEKGLNIVWISDIDIDNTFLSMDVLSAMNRYDADIFIDTVLCYERKPWISDRKYPIVAHRFISKVKFPKQLFTNFLKKLIDGELVDLINEINDYNTRKTPNRKFPYGMDEAFINGPVYGSIKRHNLKVIVRKDYFIIQSFLNYGVEGFPKKDAETLERYYRTPSHDLFKRSKDITKKYAPLLVDKYPCFQELIDKLPEFKKSFDTISLVSSKDL